MRALFLAALSLALTLAVVKPAKATGNIGKADLVGPWAVTLTGDTGCGITTMYVTFSPSSSGSGTATYQSHTSGCGDGSTTGVTFTIDTLNTNGSGTANLTCGSGCG